MPARRKSRSKSPRRSLKRRSSGKARTSVTRRSPKRRTYRGVNISTIDFTIVRNGDQIVDLWAGDPHTDTNAIMDKMVAFHNTILSNRTKHNVEISRLDKVQRPDEYVTRICSLPQLFYRRFPVFPENLAEQLNAYKGDVFDVSFTTDVPPLLVSSVKQGKVSVSHDLDGGGVIDWYGVQTLVQKVGSLFPLTVRSEGITAIPGEREQQTVDECKKVPTEITAVMGEATFNEWQEGNSIVWTWTWTMTDSSNE